MGRFGTQEKHFHAGNQAESQSALNYIELLHWTTTNIFPDAYVLYCNAGYLASFVVRLSLLPTDIQTTGSVKLKFINVKSSVTLSLRFYM